MLEISREQIDAVRNDLLLSSEVGLRLLEPSVAREPAASLSEDDWDNLGDACLEALTNDAPEVESFDAEQSKGVYSVTIRGVPGAYFVSAIEFDDSGVFSSLDEARAEADSVHGEFRLSGANDVCGMGEEEEEWEEPDPREPAFPDELLSILARTGDSMAVNAVRSQIEADDDLIMLANGVADPNRIKPRNEVAQFVVAFERTLPSPRGTIAGMMRGLIELPRLRLRVELYLRLNGRMPTPGEMAKLYGTK